MNDLLHPYLERYVDLGKTDSYMTIKPELKPEGFRPELIGVSAVRNFVLLLWAAQRMSESAFSWRNFKVGAAVMAYNFKDPALGMMTGVNWKPEKTGGANIHAEQMALAKARAMKLTHVIALAVFGDPTDTDANPTLAPTLRPCRCCDQMFQETPEIKPNTLILSGDREFSQCEMYTAAELADYYQDPNATGPVSELPVFSLAFTEDDDSIGELFDTYLLPKAESVYAAGN